MKAEEARKLAKENSVKEIDIMYGLIVLKAEVGGRSVRINGAELKEGTIRQLEEDGYEVIDETLFGVRNYGYGYIYVIRW